MKSPPDQAKGGHPKQLEAYWARRVRRFHTLYLLSNERHRRMREELSQMLPLDADGSFVVAKARRLEIMTREEFFRSLQIYVGLLKGKTPPSEDGEIYFI